MSLSTSKASFLPFANPEKGDPNPGIFILLSYFFSGFRPTTKHATFRAAISQGSLPQSSN
jgi:hypothetical protein